MKACYKKLFIMSALFLSSTYVQNEMLVSDNSYHSGHYREIAGEKQVSVTSYQVHQKGIFDLWFDTAKLFGKVENIVKIEIKDVDEKLVKDFKDLSKRYEDLQGKSDTLSQELAKSSEEISKLKSKLANVQSSDPVDDNIRQEKIKALEELIEQRTAELDTAKEAISKFDETREKLQEISEKFSALELENEELKKENAILVCELENAKSKIDTDEIKKLQDELAKITAELEDYKNDSTDIEEKQVTAEADSKEIDKDKLKAKKKEKDESEDDKLSEAELALIEYIREMKEQAEYQRQQQQEAVAMQQFVSMLTSQFTQPQVNSYFGTYDALNQRQESFSNMVRDFREQSFMMQDLNRLNNWNYSYNDYYGTSAPMLRVSESMPWGNYYAPEQSIKVQNFDYSKHGYNWDNNIPNQNFNMGINTADSNPILNNYTTALDANDSANIKLF
ncbi:hypothetical protein M902_2017 [Bacteriovorax sp. BAL6_X]|uniref:hypothetical protein n=1 Tax=Bacteriovorax sp. BAL6_X TaxID=1201290 RepID=UPI0003855531|nr:hypothetical protein [Bacteriovorax sp. BAL6_X]EPZ51696.1 hypothetical protein M902_2017 [Bacteriovorax sp. BAL6_X]